MEVIKKLEMQKEVFGNPYRIISDKRVAFTSNDFKSYCQEENIIHETTTTGVPAVMGR